MSAERRGWGSPCTCDLVTVTGAGDGGEVRISVRREIAELVDMLVDETQARGYRLRAGQCWGYCCRKIRQSSAWSNHAWGLGVDLNAPANPMVKRKSGEAQFSPRLTDMPAWLPALWKKHGFGWGGDYRTTSDAMHFEFMGTPAQAAEITRRAKAAGIGRGASGAAAPKVKPQLDPPVDVIGGVIAELRPEGGGVVLVGAEGHAYAFAGAGYPGQQDPGAVRQIDTPNVLEPIVAEAKDPEKPNGAYLLAASGAVYAVGGSRFHGGANGQGYFAGRQAARVRIADEGERAAGKVYVIQATDGAEYHYPA